jgi:hypothetical protein
LYPAEGHDYYQSGLIAVLSNVGGGLELGFQRPVLRRFHILVIFTGIYLTDGFIHLFDFLSLDLFTNVESDLICEDVYLIIHIYQKSI